MVVPSVCRIRDQIHNHIPISRQGMGGVVRSRGYLYVLSRQERMICFVYIDKYVKNSNYVKNDKYVKQDHLTILSTCQIDRWVIFTNCNIDKVVGVNDPVLRSCQFTKSEIYFSEKIFEILLLSNFDKMGPIAFCQELTKCKSP